MQIAPRARPPRPGRPRRRAAPHPKRIGGGWFAGGRLPDPARRALGPTGLVDDAIVANRSTVAGSGNRRTVGPRRCRQRDPGIEVGAPDTKDAVAVPLDRAPRAGDHGRRTRQARPAAAQIARAACCGPTAPESRAPPPGGTLHAGLRHGRIPKPTLHRRAGQGCLGPVQVARDGSGPRSGVRAYPFGVSIERERVLQGVAIPSEFRAGMVVGNRAPAGRGILPGASHRCSLSLIRCRFGVQRRPGRLIPRSAALDPGLNLS